MRKKITGMSCLIGLIAYTFFNIALAAMPTPVGSWVTIDDISKKPRSVINITKRKGKLYGHITKVYYRKGEGPNDVCQQCKGKRKGQKILGLNILWDMKPTSSTTWANGKILDPETGKVYKCKIKISPDGKKLYVRGYIGFSLLGRTQIWLRQK